MKIGNEMGNPFNTNIGTPQGDCLNLILFTLYLANALKGGNSRIPTEIADHNWVITTTSNHAALVLL